MVVSGTGTSCTAFPSWFSTSQIIYLIWQELLEAAASANEALKYFVYLCTHNPWLVIVV